MALDLIIGKSRAVSELRGLIRQAATSDASVLILGESGTGKELVARALHTGSSRSTKQATYSVVINSVDFPSLCSSGTTKCLYWILPEFTTVSFN